MPNLRCHLQFLISLLLSVSDRSSHAGYRSLLPLTVKAYTRSGQSERRVPSAPIRTPELSARLGDQRRILDTQLRVITEHKRQLWTSLRRLYFLNTLSRLNNSSFVLAPFWFRRDRNMTGSCLLKILVSYTSKHSRIRTWNLLVTYGQKRITKVSYFILSLLNFTMKYADSWRWPASPASGLIEENIITQR